MAGLRTGHCYSGIRFGTSKRIKRANTRKSRYKKKNYIKSVPTSRIIKYHMGNLKKKFTTRINLITRQPVQLRHNSIESCRLIVNRRLGIKLGNNYHFIIRTYPHHILRENKMLTGAGADRMQTGMQRAFGKATGLSAQLKKSQILFSVDCDKQNINDVKTSLKLAIPRLPGKYLIEQKEI